MKEDFLDSILNMERIPECHFSDVERESEKLFNEDVIDESVFDDWTIDDFIGALPESIEYRSSDTLAGLDMFYFLECEDPHWIVSYKTIWGDSAYEENGETLYEALKKMYIKLNNDE